MNINPRIREFLYLILILLILLTSCIQEDETTTPIITNEKLESREESVTSAQPTNSPTRVPTSTFTPTIVLTPSKVPEVSATNTPIDAEAIAATAVAEVIAQLTQDAPLPTDTPAKAPTVSTEVPTSATSTPTRTVTSPVNTITPDLQLSTVEVLENKIVLVWSYKGKLETPDINTWYSLEVYKKGDYNNQAVNRYWLNYGIYEIDSIMAGDYSYRVQVYTGNLVESVIGSILAEEFGAFTVSQNINIAGPGSDSTEGYPGPPGPPPEPTSPIYP